MKGAEEIQSLFRDPATPTKRKKWTEEEEIILNEFQQKTPIKDITKCVNASPWQIYDKIRRMQQSSVCIEYMYTGCPLHIWHVNKNLIYAIRNA